MLAIIPARKNSKGLKHKNSKKLCGKPLIAWTIEALQKAKKVSEIIVSTDDKNIINICKKYNINIPKLRPAYLSQDNSLAIDVYKYALREYNKNRKKKIYDFLVALPTCPLRNISDIDKAIDIFFKSKAKSLISCKRIHFPKEWIIELDKNSYIISDKNISKAMNNRQKFANSYVPNGSIYILNINHLNKYNSYYTNKTIAYVMSDQNAVDIDDINDFKYAEYLLKKKLK